MQRRYLVAWEGGSAGTLVPAGSCGAPSGTCGALAGSCPALSYKEKARKAEISDYIFLPLYSWGYRLPKLIFVCATGELRVCLSPFPQEDKHSIPNPFIPLPAALLPLPCVSAFMETVTFAWTRDFPEQEPFGIWVGFPGYIFNKHNNLTANPLPIPCLFYGIVISMPAKATNSQGNQRRNDNQDKIGLCCDKPVHLHVVLWSFMYCL